MSHRSRAVGALSAAAAAALIVPLAGAAQPAGSEVVVEVRDLRNTRGVVRACMTNDPERFPRCTDDAQSYRLVLPASEAGELHFHNVAPGTYAIALLHDENGNGRADRALSMIPREGFGFSRDARVRMGPPHFEDAAIAVGADTQRQQIRMRYML